jgi:hypothetical protein
MTATITPMPPKSRRGKKRKRSRDHLYLRRGIFHFRIKLNGVRVARSAHTSDREEAKKARLRALTEAEEGQLPHREEKGRLPAEKADARLENLLTCGDFLVTPYCA